VTLQEFFPSPKLLVSRTLLVGTLPRIPLKTAKQRTLYLPDTKNKNKECSLFFSSQVQYLQLIVTLEQGFPNWGTCTPRGTFTYPKGYI